MTFLRVKLSKFLRNASLKFGAKERPVEVHDPKLPPKSPSPITKAPGESHIREAFVREQK